MQRTRWEPEISQAIREGIAKAAGITGYITDKSHVLRRPGDGLRVFCPGDSPRHAFHRAVRKHFGLREFALGFRLSSWESDGTFRVQLELFDSEARPCGETHDVAFTKSTFEGRAVYDLRVDFHDGAVVDWPMIEKCASKR